MNTAASAPRVDGGHGHHPERRVADRPERQQRPVRAVAEQSRRNREGDQLRGQQHRQRREVADADVEAPTGEHRQQGRCRRTSWSRNGERDVRQQPAAGAEADDERAEERESCDHALGDSRRMTGSGAPASGYPRSGGSLALRHVPTVHGLEFAYSLYPLPPGPAAVPALALGAVARVAADRRRLAASRAPTRAARCACTPPITGTGCSGCRRRRATTALARGDLRPGHAPSGSRSGRSPRCSCRARSSAASALGASERLALGAAQLAAALDVAAAHDRDHPDLHRAGRRDRAVYSPILASLPPMKAKSEISTLSPSGTRTSPPPISEKTVISRDRRRSARRR